MAAPMNFWAVTPGSTQTSPADFDGSIDGFMTALKSCVPFDAKAATIALGNVVAHHYYLKELNGLFYKAQPTQVSDSDALAFLGKLKTPSWMNINTAVSDLTVSAFTMGVSRMLDTPLNRLYAKHLNDHLWNSKVISIQEFAKDSSKTDEFRKLLISPKFARTVQNEMKNTTRAFRTTYRTHLLYMNEYIRSNDIPKVLDSLDSSDIYGTQAVIGAWIAHSLYSSVSSGSTVLGRSSGTHAHHRQHSSAERFHHRDNDMDTYNGTSLHNEWDQDKSIMGAMTCFVLEPCHENGSPAVWNMFRRESRKTMVCGFNHEEPFFTPGHVFFTTTGLPAVDPKATLEENPWLDVGALQDGHVVLRIDESDGSYERVPIHQITLAEVECPAVHGVHLREGPRSYHANGYLVHLNYPEITIKSVGRLLRKLPATQQMNILLKLEELTPVFGRFGSSTVLELFEREIAYN
ncbi:hypothetical protein VTL71DRAFT_8560 [Oculimacula yallundae]|uniref:Uncharacterized protein n=1 Tax=Oculimacula yallundae TaxID=86028 RepID=A0ABR4CZ44_9HELO